MVKLFRKSSIVLALLLLSMSVFAGSELKPGEGYERITPVQNTQAQNTVQTIPAQETQTI